MHIKIDNLSDRPVYQQIIDQIKRDIALGRLAVGDKIPPVRQLALDIVINPNTIAKAYRQLEQDGVINTRAGSGTFVAEIQNTLNNESRKVLVCNQLELAVVDAVHTQVAQKELTNWFSEIAGRYYGRSNKI
ncbi:MAG: GntR family transcriptional regulator [Sedimentisphaerales bacterium]|nr:GntR family transcriptional regulator [Sedimentisphaerales bacterium]MBN2841852.1 GntR family transcriptional regulator [Sedimentisphaerales bacterium]